ncbi:2'-5' RNA ligase family protein [Glycomyces paridis]|uniref:2'-5' RNA ligase family protein n=1 Tax=Glycomyces paridis TaxID=2126555 RepID=A0A4S8PEA4_9ACTN|nr:2'-5' RNA ligase family protein [Glycomyces paridis]THV26684.1 2'-5' RNA ligase family protein [Glycomyces paridis]
MAKYRDGQTALLVVVDEVEGLVGPWRRRYNASAAAGLPAHVTVIVPFLDIERIDAAVSAELASLFAGQEPFGVVFERVGGFPGVRYLAPSAVDRFRELTGAVVARWPEAPPYGGVHDEVNPHLTVANGQPPEVFEAVEAAMRAGLSIAAEVSSVSLFVHEGRRWHRSAEFRLDG